MFGGIALFENICFMVGSVAGGAIYSETVAFLPGFAFWVMAGYNVIALFLLMWVSCLNLKTLSVVILKVEHVYFLYISFWKYFTVYSLLVKLPWNFQQIRFEVKNQISQQKSQKSKLYWKFNYIVVFYLSNCGNFLQNILHWFQTNTHSVQGD